tara:strand:- start:429 stop:605 length:177 start_codon:yes stop_codon:yes gene_type:complete
MTFEIGEACVHNERERSAELMAFWIAIGFSVYLVFDLVLGACVVYRKLRPAESLKKYS